MNDELNMLEKASQVIAMMHDSMIMASDSDSPMAALSSTLFDEENIRHIAAQIYSMRTGKYSEPGDFMVSVDYNNFEFSVYFIENLSTLSNEQMESVRQLLPK